MREFKFRAWNKRIEAMSDITGFDFWEKGVWVCDIHFDLDEVELMQYTGFTDCNDKEIYEGDIVKIFIDEKYPYLREIVFTDGAFQKKDKEGNLTPLKAEFANKYYKVVGNIFENKDLL